MTNLYSEILLDEAKHPRNYGLLDDPSVVSVSINASCGDSVKLSLELDPQTAQIVQVGWEGAGCSVSQAAMSILSEMLIGKTLEQAQQIELSQVTQELQLENLSAGRIKCASLGLHAVTQAKKPE